MVRFRYRGSGDAEGGPRGRGGRFSLSLFFLFFFALGSFFEIVMIRGFSRAVSQRSWQKVSCRIVSSQVAERDDSEEPYTFAVRYEYTQGGRPRTGSVYKRGYTGSEKYSDVQKLVEKYPSGQNASCYVNPKNPAEVVLRPGSLLIGLVLWFPLIFVAVGAGGLYFIWRKQPPPEARPIAAPIARHGGKSKYGLVAFFAIFALAGLAILYPLGIRPVARTLDAKSWIETPCRVVRAEVRSHDSDDGTTYSVYILYSYEHEGKRYKCDRFDFIGGSSSGYRGKARIVAQYEAMPNPVCYVNPKHPSEAVLKRGFHAKLLFALFPLPFIAVGIGGIYYTLRSKKWNTSGATKWMPKGCQPTADDDISILRQADAGPMVLRPKHSPWGKLAGAILFALIWNGIVSVLVFQVIGGFRHGQPRWGMTLFSLPFVLVGLGSLAFIAYRFMALFNPRPTLELSSPTIPLGGAAELGWRFTGRTDRIREFTVILRGVEQATYRRGTNTCTDTNTFYEMELYKTSSAANVAAGQVGFVLPQETMHSFEAENNKILWNLHIRGDIKKWPDVKESFPITVVPGAC
ncbi:MAG: DUF3592 domain-containing protein [Phycisphaerales bacterium]|nr:MAG: DUF3592 domain-containing protein [Phycisphaerales bacterium]